MPGLANSMKGNKSIITPSIHSTNVYIGQTAHIQRDTLSHWRHRIHDIVRNNQLCYLPLMQVRLHGIR